MGQFAITRLIGHYSDFRTVGESRDLWYSILMRRAKATATASSHFDELRIWRTRLPKAKHAVLSPSNNRPNPLVIGDVVYVSVFSPGGICALHRKTGKLIWRREIPRFGGSAVHLSTRDIVCKNGQYAVRIGSQDGPDDLVLLSLRGFRRIALLIPYDPSGQRIYW